MARVPAVNRDQLPEEFKAAYDAVLEANNGIA